MVAEETYEVTELASLLKGKGLTLAIAESCTGGLLGHKITSMAHCSGYFNGGVISYNNSVKSALLNVPMDLLSESGPGAVSTECAQLMAIGARDRLDSDIGVSITGIAGPGGGTKEKPVGTVFISISKGNNIITEKHSFSGERNEIREQSALAAIALIIKELKSEPS